MLSNPFYSRHIMTTPTTRELLEGAARAAGKWPQDFELGDDDVPIFDAIKGFRLAWGRGWWNPLHSMADCFEMETALKIDIEWYDGYVAADQDSDTGHRIKAKFADHNNDRKAARMYASTRCAFEIGKGM